MDRDTGARAGTAFHTVHATAVAIDGLAALLIGPSGSGKSDLAFRLVTATFRDGPRRLAPRLVADDRVVLDAVGSRLIVRPPAAIAGRMEVRGVGILEVDHEPEAEAVLVVDVAPGSDVERLPPAGLATTVAGFTLPLVRLRSFDVSAPAKVAVLLARAGPAGGGVSGT
jgi:serine kinase of HPr protein (carbohydrate metabolism regulator)